MNRLPNQEPRPAPITLELYAKGGLGSAELIALLKPRLVELGFTHDVRLAVSETPDGVSSYYSCEILGIVGGNG